MSIFEHIDKRAVIGFGVALCLILGFFFYRLGTGYSEKDSLTVLPTSPLDATLGRELLAALAKLKSTKFDTTIFEDPIFSSLKDFGVEIAAQPIGRRNPFADFGADVQKKAVGGTKAPAPSGGAAKKPPSAPSAGWNEGFDVE